MAGANLVFSHNAGGRAFLRVTANATINVAANSTVNSDLSFANDQIVGATITKLIWSTANNTTTTVARGANTIIRLSGSGVMDFKSMGVALTEFPAASIVITLGDVNSCVYIECSKLYPGGTL